MVKANIQRNGQSGFTLIEIIAVLVLLGVLAAVIVPRYNSMVAEAKDKAAMQAVAEGIARVNSSAASFILDKGVVPTNLASLTGNAKAAPALSLVAGDYSLAYADGAAGVITVTATGTAASVLGSTATGNAMLPQ